MKIFVILCQEGTYARFRFECYTEARPEDGLRRERSAERFIKNHIINSWAEKSIAFT